MLATKVPLKDSIGTYNIKHSIFQSDETGFPYQDHWMISPNLTTDRSIQVEDERGTKYNKEVLPKRLGRVRGYLGKQLVSVMGRELCSL